MTKPFQAHIQNYGLLIGLFCAYVLTSCVSSQNYTTFVQEKTKSVVTTTTAHDRVVVTFPDSLTTVSQCHQLKNSFIPALFYWGWNSTIECEIAQDYTFNYLRQAILATADSVGLNDQLAGKELNIHLKQALGSFVYENKGDVLILIIINMVAKLRFKTSILFIEVLISEYINYAYQQIMCDLHSNRMLPLATCHLWTVLLFESMMDRLLLMIIM